MNKQIKKEFLPGGERRQELLNQVPEYLKAPGLQGNKHLFCIQILKMTETEYLEALNKATNGEDSCGTILWSDHYGTKTRKNRRKKE